MGDVRATQFSKVLKSTSLKQKQNPNSYNERAKKMEYYLAIKRNKEVDTENGLEDMGWEGEAGEK